MTASHRTAEQFRGATMRNSIRTILLGMLVAGIIALPFTTYAPKAHAADSSLARANTAANVRQAPNADAARVAVLQEGQQVRIIAAGQAWHQVADMQGRVLGFVASRLLEPIDGSSGSIFTGQLAMLRGEAPTTHNNRTGSIFQQAVDSGAIENAHEENRRREAERQWNAEEQRRLEEERWQRNWAEQRRLEDERAKERAREIEEQNQWAMERSHDDGGSMVADAIQRMQRGFEVDMQRQQQALLAIQRQRQTEPLHRSESRQERTPSPARNVAPSQMSSMPREQRQYGCWANPDPGKSSCVRSDGRWGHGINRDRYIVTHENICSERIVVKMCNERESGAPLCGQDSIAPGRSKTWSSFGDSTGRFAVQWIGSRNSSEDWVCSSQMGWQN